MSPRDRESLMRMLRERRESLTREVATAEEGLQSIGDHREVELEDRAQEEGATRMLSRLDLRAKAEIEEIDAALLRIDRGTYGRCSGCGRDIPLARLRAVPAASRCFDCALSAPPPPDGADEEVGPRHGALPADLAQLGDRDAERYVQSLVHDDGRVDCEEMRIVCRHGVVHLDGAVPSEPEHRILLKLVTEIAGFTEVVDRLQVDPVLWERDGRTKESSESPVSPYEPDDPNETDDVVRSIEEGLEWTPPGEPLPDEE